MIPRKKKLPSFVLYWVSAMLLWGALATICALTAQEASVVWRRGGKVGFALSMLFRPVLGNLGTGLFFSILVLVLASIFFKIDFIKIIMVCLNKLFSLVYNKVRNGILTQSIDFSKINSIKALGAKEGKELIEVSLQEKNKTDHWPEKVESRSSQKIEKETVEIIAYNKEKKEGKVARVMSRKEGLPSIELLDRVESSKKDTHLVTLELKKKSKSLIQTLKEFKMVARVVAVTQGPSVSVFEIKPAPGLKVSRILSLSDELSLSVKAKSLRVLGAIPGKSSIGIEVSNDHPEMVSLRELLEDSLFQKESSPLTIALGRDITAALILSRLDKMPHLLIAGSTGSGKSVCMNALIMSILFKASPEQVRFIMVDPKMVELNFYEDIPHLITPVVVNPEKASDALKWAVIEMERRYCIFSEVGVRNIEGYQKRCEMMKGVQKKLEEMPYIVVIVDELADLMMTCSKDVETSIARLAQKSRAVGIHMILATQRPTVNVITGLIKANLPCRIAFKVSSAIDSRTILDAKGAERLIGRGDMLFVPPGSSDARRVQGAFVSDEEIKRVVNFIKEKYQGYEVEKQDIFSQIEEEQSEITDSDESDDPLYEKAKEVILTHKRASGSFLQRKLGVGYNRGARLMEELERNGIVSEADTNGRREILSEGNRI